MTYQELLSKCLCCLCWKPANKNKKAFINNVHVGVYCDKCFKKFETSNG